MKKSVMMKTLGQKGFTLIEVMIGIALVGIGIMVFMEISNSARIARQLATSSGEYASTLCGVQDRVNEQSLCRLAFGGPRVAGSSTGFPSVPNQLA